MRFDFLIFGATGMQGKIVTKDLLENGYSVLMCGRDKKRVEHLLKDYKKTCFEYFEAENIGQMVEIIKISEANTVINCVEGDWNMNVMNACLKAGVNVIDLGSEIPMTREQLAMDSLFKKKKIISITGCGSVPGVGNVMLRYAAKKFDTMNTIEVGFSWNSNIKKFVVPFSIGSIIDEFTDAAPIVKNCHFIKKIPLNTIEDGRHREIGKEKCFFVRHPETHTFFHYFRHQGVKNVRFYAGFPEHSFQVIKAMIDIGMGDAKPVMYKGREVIPWEFLTEVCKNIKMPEGYKEKENLWVKLIGKRHGKRKEILMECIVPTLKGWEDAGCNIDTGMPASIIAQMIKTGMIKEKGSFAPEAVVPPEPFFEELRKRKMVVYDNGRVIN